MRRAANQFDADMPTAGSYIRKAAEQVEYAADALRTGDFSDLVQGAQRFAKNQPTAFFVLSLLAGFGAVRFLKSASHASNGDGETRSSRDEFVGREGSGRSKCLRRKQEVDVTPMPEERSIAQASFGNSLAELAKLVQNEIDLARAELSDKVTVTAEAVKLMAAGAVLLIPAVVLILLAIASELVQLGLSAPLSYLGTGAGP